MDTFKQILQIALKRLHSDLKISQDFASSIHGEQNSWSFISKFAQFIEGVFTKILVQRLGEEDTYDTISNLPQSVRLNLAYDLKLTSKEQKFLFLTVAEIRNDYIHNVSNFEVSLSDYLKKLKAGRLGEIYKRFNLFNLGENVKSKEDFVENASDAIFISCTLEVVRILGGVEGYAAERKHASSRAKQAESLLPRKADNAMYMTDMSMVLEYVSEAKDILKKAGLFKIQFPSQT